MGTVSDADASARAANSAFEGRPRFFLGVAAFFAGFSETISADSATTESFFSSALMFYLFLQPSDKALGLIPQMFGCGVIHHGIMTPGRFLSHRPLRRKACLCMRTRITAHFHHPVDLEIFRGGNARKYIIICFPMRFKK